MVLRGGCASVLADKLLKARLGVQVIKPRVIADQRRGEPGGPRFFQPPEGLIQFPELVIGERHLKEKVGVAWSQRERLFESGQRGTLLP